MPLKGAEAFFMSAFHGRRLQDVSEMSAAHSGAVLAKFVLDAGWVRLIKFWPGRSQPIRRSILALIEAASAEGT